MATALKRTASTGIGSLPHHNADSALEFSFKMGLPFLPQIPIRNPWEYMIAQALEGLPGLQVERDGTVELNIDIWNSRTHGFQKKLEAAFEESSRPLAFEAFEPGSVTSSSWQSFIWELTERKSPVAKVQLAGPLTSQWALRAKNDSGALQTVDQIPGLSEQIVRLTLARALAMIRRLKQEGVAPILYIDEPALYGLSRATGKQVLAWQELKIFVQTLKREGALVGLHCCSNADWRSVFTLGLDILSIDSGLSLPNLVSPDHADPLATFLTQGGTLSLGVVNTRPHPSHAATALALKQLDPKVLLNETLEVFRTSKVFASNPDLIRRTLREAIYTPACGLAYHSIDEAELILHLLNEFVDLAWSL